MKSKTLEIKLDEIKNPNPAILATYKEANAMELFWPHRPEYKNEERIFLSSKASGKPVKHEITGIYRKQLPGGKEYVFFFEHLVTKDYFGNVVDHTRLVGRYEKPVIQHHFGLNQGSIKANSDINEMMKPEQHLPEVESTETVHEFEFEKIKPQLIKWHDDGIINNNTKLYAWASNIKYSKPYTWKEWLELPMDDLVLLGKVGNKFTGILKTQDMTKEILDAFRNTAKDTIKEELTKISK